jgi:hypothetical protein
MAISQVNSSAVSAIPGGSSAGALRRIRLIPAAGMPSLVSHSYWEKKRLPNVKLSLEFGSTLTGVLPEMLEILAGELQRPVTEVSGFYHGWIARMSRDEGVAGYRREFCPAGELYHSLRLDMLRENDVIEIASKMKGICVYLTGVVRVWSGAFVFVEVHETPAQAFRRVAYLAEKAPEYIPVRSFVTPEEEAFLAVHKTTIRQVIQQGIRMLRQEESDSPSKTEES